MTIGRYRNPMPRTSAAMLNTESLRILITLHAAHGLMLENHDRRDQNADQNDGDGRGGRPVFVGEKFAPDRMPDHRGLRTPEQIRNDEFADDRNEAEQGACDHAWRRQ